MHGQMHFIGEIFYGFNEDNLFLRIDPLREGFAQLRECEFRLVFQAGATVKLFVRVYDGKLGDFSAEQDRAPGTVAKELFTVGVGKILEVRLSRSAFVLAGQRAIRFSASLWREGMSVDVAPSEGSIEFPLGEDFFAWRIDPADGNAFST